MQLSIPLATQTYRICPSSIRRQCHFTPLAHPVHCRVSGSWCSCIFCIIPNDSIHSASVHRPNESCICEVTFFAFLVRCRSGCRAPAQLNKFVKAEIIRTLCHCSVERIAALCRFEQNEYRMKMAKNEHNRTLSYCLHCIVRTCIVKVNVLVFDDATIAIAFVPKCPSAP